MENVLPDIPQSAYAWGHPQATSYNDEGESSVVGKPRAPGLGLLRSGGGSSPYLSRGSWLRDLLKHLAHQRLLSRVYGEVPQ